MPKLYGAFAEAFVAEGVETQFVLMRDGNMRGPRPSPNCRASDQVTAPSSARPSSAVTAICERFRQAALKHDPEKWKPIFRKDHFDSI
jgi:hypothetical protein